MAVKKDVSLCDSCIKKLINLTGKPGRRLIYEISQSNGLLTQTDLRNKLGSNQFQISSLCQELVGKGFINYKEIGTSYAYYLTSNGQKVAKLLSEQVKNKKGGNN